MAATFELRFEPSGGQPVAEIGLLSPCGEINRPTLTIPCKTFDEFIEEIHLLRKELDKIEAEAKQKFSDATKRKSRFDQIAA